MSSSLKTKQNTESTFTQDNLQIPDKPSLQVDVPPQTQHAKTTSERIILSNTSSYNSLPSQMQPSPEVSKIISELKNSNVRNSLALATTDETNKRAAQHSTFNRASTSVTLGDYATDSLFSPKEKYTSFFRSSTLKGTSEKVSHPFYPELKVLTDKEQKELIKWVRFPKEEETYYSNINFDTKHLEDFYLGKTSVKSSDQKIVDTTSYVKSKLTEISKEHQDIYIQDQKPIPAWVEIDKFIASRKDPTALRSSIDEEKLASELLSFKERYAGYVYLTSRALFEIKNLKAELVEARNNTSVNKIDINLTQVKQQHSTEISALKESYEARIKRLEEEVKSLKLRQPEVIRIPVVLEDRNGGAVDARKVRKISADDGSNVNDVEEASKTPKATVYTNRYKI